MRGHPESESKVDLQSWLHIRTFFLYQKLLNLEEEERRIEEEEEEEEDRLMEEEEVRPMEELEKRLMGELSEETSPSSD